jgi:hypothetical protein
VSHDAKANTLQDGSSQVQNNNWFLGWSTDAVNEKAGESETIL